MSISPLRSHTLDPGVEPSTQRLPEGEPVFQSGRGKLSPVCHRRLPVHLARCLFLVLCLTASLPLQLRAQPGAAADPRIAKLIGSVSEERLRELLTRLTSFVTRHTLSDTASETRGIGAARRWIYEELQRSSPRLEVSFDIHRLAPQPRLDRAVELRNVVAVLPGRSPRRVYITAHYDTVALPGGQILRNQSEAGVALPPPADPDAPSPGANDDGSGTVLTMELARVLAQSGIEFEATLVFACWAGEEEGSYGARAHAAALESARALVEANLNNDIVGNPRGGNGVVDSTSVRVYSEGPEDSMSRSLARYVRQVAAVYLPSHRIRLMARHDRFNRGSDHSAFNRHGYPAVVFRESNENWSRQHSAEDTLDGVDFAYLAQNARVNAAAAASLALAPPAPRVTNDRGQALLGRQPSGYDANLRWNPSPGAAGYRIYWRDAWTPDWEHSQRVGNVTQYVMPNLAIDNFVFGVAAVDAEGHESLIRTYVSPPPNDPPVVLQ